MGWFWGWHSKGEDSRARSCGQSQLRLVVPSELRPHLCLFFENWKQSPVRCAGPLAAGMGSNSAQFSKFGNHETVRFMLAPPGKSDLQNQKVSWRHARRLPPFCTPTPSTFPFSEIHFITS